MYVLLDPIPGNRYARSVMTEEITFMDCMGGFRLFLMNGMMVEVTEGDYLRLLAIRHPNEKKKEATT